MADEAAALAERLVGDLLPPSMASWLAAKETEIRTGMQPFPRVAEPERTPEMMAVVTMALTSLSEILEPSAKRRPELAVEIAKLFAAFNLYTGDAAKSAAQVEVWGEQLGEFPLFAIRKAYRWAVRGEGKMPSLAPFIADIRIAKGTRVGDRRPLLERWMRGAG
ncbi:hypothetical protein HFO42_19745 [Rhizobium leguminosarum]|uniref:Uncharacterized protein n=2 Tax=Rhizobium leguminosarum TaxID=384 RepID=A0AAJ1EF54_RHILE|nr:hypothetical protein [Rhizobium leguminosarum]MBY5597281.1 hypothetical protein [Rhizobium leguminosarum]MBY5617278.1 hypothetical protein [Rhizobium leguminosarum]MBY5630323.1 hypothetical protein [Rhizobium leguminosarum]MBY5732666.1 hypothetical protein [Rhizobium leguminosarum]